MFSNKQSFLRHSRLESQILFHVSHFKFHPFLFYTTVAVFRKTLVATIDYRSLKKATYRAVVGEESKQESGLLQPCNKLIPPI